MPCPWDKPEQTLKQMVAVLPFNHLHLLVCGQGFTSTQGLQMESQLVAVGCRQRWACGSCGAGTWRSSLAAGLQGSPPAPDARRDVEVDGQGRSLPGCLMHPSGSTRPYVCLSVVLSGLYLKSIHLMVLKPSEKALWAKPC